MKDEYDFGNAPRGKFYRASFEEIRQKFLDALKDSSLLPEQLFERSGVKEEDGRDVLADLVDSGAVIVGRGWMLRLSK